MELATGLLHTERAPRGIGDAIDLNKPPLVSGSAVVGKFHTHPNPAAEGWVTGPSPDDLIVDLFAGSAAMAHAVMLQNKADGGTRRFLMVNLPEPTPEGSAARAAGCG